MNVPNVASMSWPIDGRRFTLDRRRLLVRLTGAGIALTALGRGGLASVSSLVAAQSTPAATPTPDDAAIFVQFIHFEKMLAPYGVMLDEEGWARLYGLDAPTYHGIRQQFDLAARGAAEELLADAAFAARIDRLPFAAGDRIIGIGDSLTDDLQSWLSILRHLLAIRRPHDGIEVVNEGISSDTTTDVRVRFVPILAAQPTWIICLLGTNDASRYGRQSTKLLVDTEETVSNLLDLRDQAANATTARWVWITPPTCDEATVAASPVSTEAEMTLANADLVAIAEALRRQPDPVVDLITLFGQPPRAGLLLADGIHPSLAGHQAITRALVEHLSP